MRTNSRVAFGTLRGSKSDGKHGVRPTATLLRNRQKLSCKSCLLKARLKFSLVMAERYCKVMESDSIVAQQDCNCCCASPFVELFLRPTKPSWRACRTIMLLSLPCVTSRGRHRTLKFACMEEHVGKICRRHDSIRKPGYRRTRQMRPTCLQDWERWLDGWDARFWTCLEEARCRIWKIDRRQPSGSNEQLQVECTQSYSCWTVSLTPRTSSVLIMTTDGVVKAAA